MAELHSHVKGRGDLIRRLPDALPCLRPARSLKFLHTETTT